EDSGNGVFTVAANKTVQTMNGTLTISAADVNLAGLLNSGTKTTTIEGADGESIGLGAGGGGLQVSQTGLWALTLGNLVIGSSATTGLGTTGNITVDGVTTTSQQGSVTLLTARAGSGITFSGSASSFTDLSGTADSFINVNAGLSVKPGNVFLDSNGT